MELPPDAVTLDVIEPGQHGAFPDRLTHRKTLPFIIVAQAMRGSYEVRWGTQHCTARPGECFVVKPNTEVTIVHHAPPGGFMAARWVHLQATLLGVLDLGALLEPPLHVDVTRSRALGAAIAGMLRLRQHEESLARRMTENELGFRIMRLLCELAPYPTALKQLLEQTPRFVPLLAWVREHIHESLEVPVLAKQAGLSVARFHAAFQQWAGRSPMRYVRTLRLAEARRRLLLSDRTIADVANATGFINQFHFSRAFRTQYGENPSRYRIRHRGMVV